MKVMFGKSPWEMPEAPLEAFLNRAAADGFEVVEVLPVIVGAPAQSVVAAERSFPIMESSNQMDPHPLMRAVENGIVPFDRSRHGSRSYLLAILSAVGLGTSLLVFRRGIKR